jgi:hypothetical protein
VHCEWISVVHYVVYQIQLQLLNKRFSKMDMNTIKDGVKKIWNDYDKDKSGDLDK